MKEVTNHPVYGEIVYDENFWSGKKTLYIGGKPLDRLDKKTFRVTVGEESKTAIVVGSIMSGVSVMIDGENIEITRKTTWYEMVLSILIFVINIVWANNPALVSIFPIVGGALGGGICGLIGMTNLIIIKKMPKIWQKLLVTLGMIVASLLICFILALIILSSTF